MRPFQYMETPRFRATGSTFIWIKVKFSSRVTILPR
jgi:hypothetical protein